MGFKVMQIEVSNICSLTCTYCPHPSQIRPKGNMSMEVFAKCIEAVRRSDNPAHKGKKLLYLNHFGEPLLNPLLPEFIRYAVSHDVEVTFASNGVDHSKTLFPRELWQRLADAGLKAVELSAHVKSERTLRNHIGDIAKVTWVFKPKPGYLHNWVGQVSLAKYRIDPDLNIPLEPCDYETQKMFAVTWDGKLAACCYDIEGRTPYSIDDALDGKFTFQKVPMCPVCTLGRGDASMLSVEKLIEILG